MQFKETWQAVLDGRKTVTRRLCKLGESAIGTTGSCVEAGVPCIYGGRAMDNGHNAWCDGIGTGGPGYPYPPSCYGVVYDITAVCHDSGRIKWAVGRTYAVQPGRGKKAVGRILITAIRRERLGDITEDSAIAEGVPRNWKGDHIQTIDLDRHHKQGFAALWGRVHGAGSWERDRGKEVWVVEFERVAEIGG